MSAHPTSPTSPTTSRLVPYITSRECEHPDRLSSLRALHGPDGRMQLGYWDELREDRDLRGVLWGRCSQTIGTGGLPTGRPRWRMVHPSRQRETMQQLRCQVCAQPARARHGIIFLAGPGEVRSKDPVVRTAQPPVCLEHARLAAEQCPHLAGRPTVFLVQSAPLYGVIGTPYQYSGGGLHALPATDEVLPYGHPGLRWYLASRHWHACGASGQHAAMTGTVWPSRTSRCSVVISSRGSEVPFARDRSHGRFCCSTPLRTRAITSGSRTVRGPIRVPSKETGTWLQAQ